jgi:AcrR family transcriptional regulator
MSYDPPSLDGPFNTLNWMVDTTKRDNLIAGLEKVDEKIRNAEIGVLIGWARNSNYLFPSLESALDRAATQLMDIYRNHAEDKSQKRPADEEVLSATLKLLCTAFERMPEEGAFQIEKLINDTDEASRKLALIVRLYRVSLPEEREKLQALLAEAIQAAPSRPAQKRTRHDFGAVSHDAG